MLTIIILGGASLHNKKGKYPEFKDAIEYAKKQDINLNFILADPNLKYVKRAKENLRYYKTPTILEDVNLINTIPNVTIEDSWKVKIPNNDVIFISYTGLTSSYEIMSLINSYEIKKRWFLPITNDNIELKLVISDYISIKKRKLDNLNYLIPEIYDLYRGDVLTPGYEGDMYSVYTQIMLGCEIMIQYIKAGYQSLKNEAFVDGWTLNVETPIIKGIIYTYNLIPTIPDKLPHMEIRTNETYRQQLMNLIARVISNFVINNKLKINDIKDWYNIDTYIKIKEEFIKFNMDKYIIMKNFNYAEKENITSLLNNK
jgi:hypothetical protein